jgi:hypothetical protein
MDSLKISTQIERKRHEKGNFPEMLQLNNNQKIHENVTQLRKTFSFFLLTEKCLFNLKNKIKIWEITKIKKICRLQELFF